jgi:predicted DsbA family dithiol-disulfide isomerase
MVRHLKIDFISDVSCPWCAIGLAGLERALENVRDVADAEIVFRPFELNPGMPFEGQNVVDYVAARYGSSWEESAMNREVLRSRAADLGFSMPISDSSRMYNTFDAHRLLHWAAGSGRQLALKRALFRANFSDGLNPSDAEVLVQAATDAGLDAAEARDVVASGRYADEVRQEIDRWRSAGVTSVPSVVVDGRYMISGGQPPEAFERALRKIAVDALV